MTVIKAKVAFSSTPEKIESTVHRLLTQQPRLLSVLPSFKFAYNSEPSTSHRAL